MATGQSIYTLLSFSEEVLRMLTELRPGQETKLEKREIARFARAEASSLIRGRWFEMRNTGESKNLHGLFLATFDNVEIQTTVDGEEFIDLPAVPEIYPDETGLQNIQPQTGSAQKDEPMIPIPQNADIVLRGLPAGALEQRFGFMQRQYQVYFTKKNGASLADEKITKVQVRMITVGPEDVADDVPFPIPTDMWSNLFTKVLAKFGVSQEADLVNDNR